MKAKKVLNKVSDVGYVIRLYISIISSILVGVLHLIGFMKTKSYITFFYMIFCFAYAFSRVIIHLIRKKTRILYLVSALLVIVTTIPLVLTISLKTNANETKNTIFLVVFYCVYSFIKLSSSLTRILLSKHKEREDRRIIPYFSMLSTLYTIFMFVHIIVKVSINKDFEVHNILGLNLMLWFMILYALALVFYFIIIQIKILKNIKNQELESVE